MRKALLGIAALVAALGTATAQAEASKAYEGRKLFASYCYLCHGVDGKGGGPLAGKLSKKPKNIAGQQTAAKSDRELFDIIRGNKPHGAAKPMPKFGQALPDTEIEALVAYVRFLGRAPFPLMGDPDAGRSVYKRYCVVCHGEKGTGHGTLTQLLPIKPANHTDPKAMKRLDNRELITVITRGSRGKGYMPAWEGTLSRDEIEAVASYIRLLSYK